MGKKKSGGAAPPPPAKGKKQEAEADEDEGGDPELGGLFEDELDITVQTITFLAERPELFMSKPFRELRAALDPLVQLQLKKYDVPDFGARTTAALKDRKWADAILAMQGVRAHNQPQKQGTLQRWVRDCGFTEDEMLRMRLLDMVVRCGKPDGETSGGNAHDPAAALAAASAGAGVAQAGAAGRSVFPNEMSLPMGIEMGGGGLVDGSSEMRAPEAMTGCSITHHPRFTPPPRARPPSPPLPPSRPPPKTNIVHFEKGPDRQPPNKHDLKMFHIPSPGWIDMAPTQDMAPHVSRADVPGVPGAFVLVGALSRRECAQIIETAEGSSMSYSPHHPVSRDESTGIDECEWLAGEELVGSMMERIQHLVPPTLMNGKAHGVNPRWRLFRYSQGAVYRPHIDGSWPGGGLSKQGKYETNEASRSRLTFLVYLNDGFEGGCTTFYLPSPSKEGDIDARAVVPACGNILCFPQGNTASLVHEGSAVSSGVKYVIRSDLLYTVPEPAAR